MLNPKKGKILIIDDNEDVLFTLKLILRPVCENITTCNTPARINTLVSRNHYEVILLDMNFTQDAVSGREGFYWLERIREIDQQSVVIFITAYPDTEKTVKAIKAGATDFIAKPWQNEKLLATVSAALQLGNSRKEIETLKQQKSLLSSPEPATALIGECPAIKNILNTIQKLANTEANVLLLGENGTGKDLIAHLIHKNSPRSREVYIPIDLGCIPDNLFESELFGYEKGAFTDAGKEKPGRFEMASGGTLFLNEIGNLSLSLQAKLLTAIEQRQVYRLGSTVSRSVDIRLICATNADLPAWVANGQFRQDLFYRINTLEIHIPPLRQRGEDILLLTRYFLQMYNRKYQKHIRDLSHPAQVYLLNYPWPGNVRELQHTIERGIILCEKNILGREDLEPRHSISPVFPEPETANTLNLNELEKQTIQKALQRCNGNMSQAAILLGITRTSLYRRLEKYNL